MAIFLDSAHHDEIREARAWGCVSGITTNPARLAAAGEVALDALKPLCELAPGRVFYQLTTHDVHSMLLEAQAAFSVSPSQEVIKVPSEHEGLRVVARLSLEVPCAMTALFSPAQAYLAREAGARYVVPYFNRSTRLLGDGAALIAAIARALDGEKRGSTEIVASSITSPAEAVAALDAGAHHLALPLGVSKEMAQHPLSEQAIREFDRLCA